MAALIASTPIETVTVTAKSPTPAGHSHFWGGKSFSFHDVLDAVNPLQHLPIVGTIYRAITGDKEGNVAEIVGDGLYGGPLGLVSGAVDVAVKEMTGKDIGEHIMALFRGSSEPDKAPANAAEAPVAAATKPAAPNPNQPVDLPYFPAATPPAPSFGNPAIASALASAAPTTPLDAAEAERQQTPAAAPAASNLKPLAGPGFIPIDTSAKGILAIRAASAAHSPQPVALALPPGALASAAPNVAAAQDPEDFATKMREGLDKYDAFMAVQSRLPSGGTIDQIH